MLDASGVLAGTCEGRPGGVPPGFILGAVWRMDFVLKGGLTGAVRYGIIPIDLLGMETPMLVSQKCQYALRALFELAKREGEGPVRIADVAEAQAIPPRFLEGILGQLKQAGFVRSHRGSRGGYELARPAGGLTVGEVMRFVEGPLSPVMCALAGAESDCPLRGECVFLPMWEEAQRAISEVYDNTTFADLVAQEVRGRRDYVPCYAI
jgi:Rrf2 family protein